MMMKKTMTEQVHADRSRNESKPDIGAMRAAIEEQLEELCDRFPDKMKGDYYQGLRSRVQHSIAANYRDGPDAYPQQAQAALNTFRYELERVPMDERRRQEEMKVDQHYASRVVRGLASDPELLAELRELLS